MRVHRESAEKFLKIFEQNCIDIMFGGHARPDKIFHFKHLNSPTLPAVRTAIVHL